MTEAEAYEALQRLAKRREKSMNKFDADEAGIRASIGKRCKHRFTESYGWEHDDGYGRQKRMEGAECLVCGKRNSWPGMSSLWS